MGNCCSLCCFVCFKNTFYSMELTDCILNKMETHIRKTIPIGSGIQTWFISMKREIFEKVKKSLISRLSLTLEKLKFPILNSNGFMKEHIAENIAYVLSSCLFNNEFKTNLLSNTYECLDIPTNTIFYSSSTITISQEKLQELVKYFTTMMNESGEIYQVEINTTENTYHKIFDERLEERLLNTLHSIPSNKFEEIISNVYTNFMNKNNNEEKILEINRKSIKENSKEEEIRYTSFV